MAGAVVSPPSDSELFVFACCRLMSSGSLRKLLAGWNEVSRLAERVERSQLEVLDLQHNHLTDLPHNIFIKAQRCACAILFHTSACVLSMETFIPASNLSCLGFITVCGT